MIRAPKGPLTTIVRMTAFGLVVLVSASLGAACGGDVSCEDWCAQVESCEGFLGGAESCSEFCSQADQANDLYGCEDLFQEFINCADGADDPCQPTDCISEVRDYSDCIVCGANPDDSDC